MDIQEFNKKVYKSVDTVERYAFRYKLRPDERILMEKLFTKKNAELLVLGCGAGRTAIPFACLGFNVVGIDISENMIKKAEEEAKKEGVGIEFIVGDMAYIQDIFKNKKFDYIFAPFHSLDYVAPQENRYKTIKGASQLLKEGGVFIFNSHNRWFIKYMLNYIFSKNRPFVEDKTSYGGGAVMSFYANVFIEKRKARQWFKNIKMLGRSQIFTPKKRGIKLYLRRWLPLVFEKSLYLICYK